MATIVNNPGTTDSSGGGTGLIIGALVAIIIIALFFLYGLPALRGTNNSGTNGGTNINVPGKIDVNVNKTPSPQY